MRVLVACEWSGTVRDAFRTRGHDAYSCDIDATDYTSLYPEYHIIGDVRDYLDKDWDLIIGFPPCTYLTVAANRSLYHNWRIQARLEAIEFVKTLWNAPAPRIALENPVGVLSTQWQKPTQYIQPFWFGDPYLKKTGLWLKSLPPLERDPEHYVHGPVTPWVQHSGTQLGKMLGGVARDPKLRGRTFLGVARAMAQQWGSYGD